MKGARKSDRSVGTRIAVIVGSIFTCAAIAIVVAVNLQMKANALADARVQARIILDRNLAIHGYFNERLKPELFEVVEPLTRQGYFAPVWMSSTYAIREINKRSKVFSDYHYYYKECAINARAPENEADEFERAFIRQLNAVATLTENTSVRTINGEPFFVVLRRGETMERSCLQCHSTPVSAPTGLLRWYGEKRSFSRSSGETVSAVSIRIPLASAYARADKLSLQLSLFLIFILVCLYLIQFWLNRRLLFLPLRVITAKAEQIAGGADHLGEEILLPRGRELKELASAFNAMSVGLRATMDRVKLQTDELKCANRELRTSENKFRSLIHKVPTAIVLHDGEGNILDSNPLAQELLGVSAEQLLGRKLIDPELQFLREDGSVSPAEEYPVSLVLSTRKPLKNYVTGFSRPDRDGVSWMLVNAEPECDDAGNIMQVIVSFIDITERKEGERRIALLSFALDSVREAAFLIDEMGLFHYVNEESSRVLGYTREELLTLGVAVIDPDFPSEQWPGHWADIKERGSLTFEGRHRAKDGKLFPVEINFNYIEYDGQGYNLALARDITERKHTERKLQEQLHFLQQLLDSIPIPVYYKDTDGLYLGCNTPFERFMCLPRSDIIGKTVYEVLPKERADIHHEADLALLRNPGVQEYELGGVYRDGKFHGVIFNKAVFVDEDNRVAGIIGVAIDITERNKIQEALRKFNEELELRVKERTGLLKQRTDELEQAYETLKEADRAKSAFLAAISHELRTPLNSIIGFSSILHDEWVGPVNKEQKENLATILNSGRDLLNMINDVLDVTQIEAGAIIPDVEEFELHDLLAEAENEVAAAIREKGLELRSDLLRQRMRTDRRRLMQYLRNVLSNAMKYTDRGSVTVTARFVSSPAEMPGEEMVEIAVTDTGIGIGEEDQEKIFQPFYRVVTPQREIVPGTGLGLFLTRKIATEILKGDIIVSSESGKGSRFSLRIPVRLP